MARGTLRAEQRIARQAAFAERLAEGWSIRDAASLNGVNLRLARADYAAICKQLGAQAR